jgi:hypothetical protein
LSFAHLLPKNNAFQRHFLVRFLLCSQCRGVLVFCVSVVCVVVVVVVAQTINSSVFICQCCSLSTQQHFWFVGMAARGKQGLTVLAAEWLASDSIWMSQFHLSLSRLSPNT